MGMTPEQYWEQDCRLAGAYRKAYKIKQDDQNRFAWLQGMYVYEAIADIAPILNAFAKRGTRASPYRDRPYEFSKPKKKTAAEKIQEKKQNVIDYMERMTARFNQSFAKRQANAEAQRAAQKAADSAAGKASEETQPSPTKQG